MIQIQCTRKTLDEFDIKSDDFSDNNNLYNWHANLFFLNGIRCLYLINDLNYFGFVVYNVCDFERQIKEEMKRVLLLSGIISENVDDYLDDKYIYTKASNRKIISKMNSMIKIVKYNYLRGDEDIDHINRMLWEYL